MASFFLLGVILAAILLISIFLISFISMPANITRPLPPGSTGWPLIGESLSFISNPEKFVRDRMSKYSSNVFQTSIAGERVAVLCGPAGNRFVFSNDNKLVKPWWPKIITKALTFPDPNFDPTTPTLKEEHPFLKIESMRQYVCVMDLSIRDHLVKYWAPYNKVMGHKLAKELVFALGCKVFINYQEDQVKELADPFFAVFRGLMSVPVNFPGTPYYAAMKAGRIVKAKIVAIIKQRKKELESRAIDDQDPDFLTKFLMATNKNGRFFTQEEIANKLIGYFIGSFVATSNAITYVLNYLAEYPHIYHQVLKEQREIAKPKEDGEQLTRVDIQKMKYSWNVVCESLRLMSPNPGTFKEVLVDDLTFAGFNIPKGWKVLWTPLSTNKDPKYYPNPEKFDPSRFEAEGPQACTFVPFGGGPHMCGGIEYARINILIFMHNLVIRFKLKKVNPNEKIIYSPDPTPIEGLPLYLESHRE